MAKQKARRSAKRAILLRSTSNDPTIRLQQAEKWPVVQSLVSVQLWDEGMGYLVLARQDSEGRLIYAVFLMDVYCLGVKNAFGRAGTRREFKDMIRRMEKDQKMRAITPACLMKIVQGAVEYAQSFGFQPHPDFRHASMLLAGIDASTCPNQFSFGRDGKPFYISGPNETFAQSTAILQRIQAAGGDYFVQIPGPGLEGFPALEREGDPSDSPEEDDAPEELP
jgi:hypothetical protein